jgi:hypothetical protein
LQPVLARRRGVLHLDGLGECREQRLRLDDLRHFRRWRKPFERGRENVVRLDRAVGRLVEFCERESGAQFETARALLFRDGDGGLKGFLGSRGVGGLALDQHFAADAIQIRFERAMTGPVAGRQRLVKDRERAVDIACPGFGLGQRDFQQPIVVQNALLAQQLSAAAHFLEPAARHAAFSPRQPREKNRIRSPHRQIMLTRQSGEFEGVQRGAREVAPHQFEQGCVRFLVCVCADMCEPRGPLLGVASEGDRAFDVAQRP